MNLSHPSLCPYSMGAPFFTPFENPCCPLSVALIPSLPASLSSFSPAVPAPVPDAWPSSWAQPASVYSPSVIFLENVHPARLYSNNTSFLWPFMAFWKKQTGLLVMLPNPWVYFSCSSGHTAGQPCMSRLSPSLE